MSTERSEKAERMAAADRRSQIPDVAIELFARTDSENRGKNE